MSKIVTLSQIQQLATRVKTEDDALGVKIADITTKVEGLVATGGEANVLDGVKVNGQAMAITDKMVDLLIASGEENGTISVNGAAVAITGLQALAYKAEISEDDLDAALLASIAAKATDADLQALAVRVTDAEGKITEIQGDIAALEAAGYQNAEQVQTAIQSAIAASTHLKKEVVEAVPTADAADENTLYLVMNDDTGHYDIYGLVGGAVVLLDDTTVDLSGYSTTEQMNGAISAAIEALNIGDYAKAADLLAAVERVTAVEAKFSDYYTKEEAEAKFTDETEAAAIASEAVSNAQATDEEFNAAMDEVWTPTEG